MSASSKFKSILATAGLFTGLGLMAAEPKNAVVISSGTNLGDTFKDENALSFGVRGCDAGYKGAQITITANPSDSDLDKFLADALPENMRKMSDEDKQKYLESLPEDQAEKIIADYISKVSVLENAMNSGTRQVFNKGLEGAVNDKGSLDRDKAVRGLTAAFQEFANKVENVTGVSMKIEIAVEDFTEGDEFCAEKKQRDSAPPAAAPRRPAPLPRIGIA